MNSAEKSDDSIELLMRIRWFFRWLWQLKSAWSSFSQQKKVCAVRFRLVKMMRDFRLLRSRGKSFVGVFVSPGGSIPPRKEDDERFVFASVERKEQF